VGDRALVLCFVGLGCRFAPISLAVSLDEGEYSLATQKVIDFRRAENSSAIEFAYENRSRCESSGRIL
jgi:hypothetical protein